MSVLSTEEQQARNDGSTQSVEHDVTTKSETKSDHYGSFKNIEVNTASSLSNDKHDCSAKKKKLTYMKFLSNNSNYRYYLLSYLVNHMGEWLTYLASLTLIQRVTAKKSAGMNQNSNTMVSTLILVKLLPNVILLPIGGVLADSYDRRSIQIILDLLCSCVVVVFLWSLCAESVTLCLIANLLIETASGLYIPSSDAIIPQLVSGNGINSADNDEALKKANVLHSMSWSLMTAFGSALGGFLVAAFGIQGCFIIDSITYLVSAAIMYFGVQGNYNASSTLKSTDECEVKLNSADDEHLLLLEVHHESMKEDPRSNRSVDTDDDDDSSVDPDDSGEIGGLVLFVNGLKFLFRKEPLVGACALLKGSASLVYGAVDVLNVAFSARGSESDPSKTSVKLGFLFGCVGVGCIIGSAASDAFSDMSLPRRTARVCLGGFLSIGIGMLWMWATPDNFASVCLSTVIRSIGSSVVWINSSLLIQKFTPPELLGRVSSFDSGAALCAEALSALVGAMLMDQKGLSPEGLALILGCIALLFFFVWSPLAFRF
mmetsp:Transcript_24217/g.57063  ORF Transcript_24217/g.57063 Transcript_24217/m.57063 type:complete len:543 (+) Transcript_24217:147-1775(+)|eukprot:CAMPEP_0197192544 /NCGR_PEP_ID=MMETSP1423-20130617/25209_1 /TAXON_ID=476441 /ORGANISM="Pseudo-nitzschia heimii, Strain UNC1101" /LENGTH=542 /DNA_ID=CAMNT_0042645445 /DNA_START=76 /DNA_END=1704 /DNA_ORIENTATION=+